MSDTNAPEKNSKAQLEQLIKANGGKIYQTNTAVPDTVCIADRSKFLIIRHKWKP
jgi:DNA ligase 4